MVSDCTASLVEDAADWKDTAAERMECPDCDKGEDPYCIGDKEAGVESHCWFFGITSGCMSC